MQDWLPVPRQMLIDWAPTAIHSSSRTVVWWMSCVRTTHDGYSNHSSRICIAVTWSRVTTPSEPFWQSSRWQCCPDFMASSSVVNPCPSWTDQDGSFLSVRTVRIIVPVVACVDYRAVLPD
ncbi:hypothetical protein [Pseudomonas phage PIP]|nr:hypothetical protein [Pseudomonas phage PIP]